MSRAFIAVAVAGAGAAVCALVFAPPRTVAGPPSPDLAAEITRLRAELAALRGDVARRPERIVERASAPAPEATTAGSETAAGDRAPIPTRTERAAELEQRVRAEPVDVAWAGEHERAISAFFAATHRGAQLTAVRCAASLCRLEIAHATRADRSELMAEMMFSPPFDNTEVLVGPTPDAGDERATVLYVARPGRSLSLI